MRWVSKLLCTLVWIGLVQMEALAATPEGVLQEALAAFQRGQLDVFKQRISDALQHEWRPSVYAPHFTLVKVPKQERGNVGFALLRETARSLRDSLAQQPVGQDEARLAVDYLLKLVRSRSPQPDLYFLAVRACWVMLRPPLARYVDQRGHGGLRKRFSELERLHTKDSKHLSAIQGRLRGEQAAEVAGRRIAAYAAKRLPLWEKKLLEVRQLL